MYCRESYAVTEIVALILVMSIVISSISLIMLWGIPSIEAEKAKSLKESALIQFEMINEVIIISNRAICIEILNEKPYIEEKITIAIHVDGNIIKKVACVDVAAR